MLDNQYALLFIRGERPIKDLKYDILKHPYVKLSTDGGGKPFQYGYEDHSVAVVSYEKLADDQSAEETPFQTDEPETGEAKQPEDQYEIYSNEEIDELLKELEDDSDV